MKINYIKDLVSVIIPVYNAEENIHNTLESVFNQTYKSIEIILVDDCSQDNSYNIINSYLEEHSEIKYYRNPINLGAGQSRNKALELSSGQYVAFLDADDIWLPEKIEKQITLLKEKNSGFSYTAICMINKNNKIIKSKRNVKSNINYNFLLRNTMIATSSVMIDRYIFGDFRMSLRRGGQDYATWLNLLSEGAIAYGINESLCYYRINNKNSLANNKWKSIKQVWLIQTQDQNVKKISAIFNLLFFIVNAAKKYFF